MTPQQVRVLVERLSQVPSVVRFDQPQEPQAETIAHSLSHLEGSFHKILDVLVPRFFGKLQSHEEINDTLLEIGEEFRHILYHIRDPLFFQYLFDD